MDKIYLLLRNNKQTGPHSVEELLQFSLKPTDLIWIEGRSAGWRNPMEVDDLKSYVPGSSQQIINQADTTMVEKIETATQRGAKAFTTESPIIQKQSKNIFVSLPAGLQIPVAAKVAEESISENLDRKAQELYNKVQAFSQAEKALQKNESGIDTKYTRSLNDIKEEYTRWLKQQKRADRVKVKKPLMMAAVVLLSVVALGLFLNSLNRKIPASSFTNNSSSALLKIKVAEQISVMKNDTFTSQKENLSNDNFSGYQTKKDGDKIIGESSLPFAKAKVQIDAPIIEERMQMQPVKEEKIVMNEKDDAVLQTSTSQVEITEKPSVSITQLIDVDGNYLPNQKGDGVNGYRVEIKNNSDEVLKVVAVDVFYYAANDKLLNKKTLYFSNVSPGANMILTAPSNKYAISVNHQLGLVSSEEGAIYFVKQ